MSSIRDVLLDWSSKQPDAPLFISPETDRVITYGMLLDQSRSLLSVLLSKGIRPGAHVGLYLQNGIQTMRLFLSIMAAGYVVTPFNLLAHEEQLGLVLEHSDCELVFFGSSQATALATAKRHVTRSFIAVEIDPDALHVFGESEASDLPTLSPDSPALLMYTSGTTGTPKGVRLSHRNLLTAAQSVSEWHRLSSSDRVLSSLPIYHINGQSIATITPFFSGGSIVTPQKFSISQWWPSVLRYQCTWINMVPTIINYLLNAADKPDAPSAQELRHVRFGRSASAPLSPDQHQAFERRFGITVIEAMGMTESASVVFCNPHDQRRRYGSPGLPCGVQAKVVDPRGTELADGQTGELCLRGGNVMSEYYKSKAETEKAFDSGGWLKTGDLGHRDADGFYFVTGRLKELIIKGGENIAPREIDEILLQHPSVLEAACVGIPDAAYGQEIMVFVVLKDQVRCDEAELREFCLRRLGRYKTPKIFRFSEDLPRGPSGKVQRLKLLDWA
ncbi:MAG: long-chain fatty acid--CoA ligase [Betaproteobacteria bacterium]|nr:long-chain fatty acid--CoA ligase [Betaproteobacteria bacterium]NBT74881.1 long-chain fatty acid--CoA ligase [Betaproteobacteria bacterium]NCA15479.1 long-chain fatty acid--CoA ligase [Betaproteobacteria bacterium]